MNYLTVTHILSALKTEYENIYFMKFSGQTVYFRF